MLKPVCLFSRLSKISGSYATKGVLKYYALNSLLVWLLGYKKSLCSRFRIGLRSFINEKKRVGEHEGGNKDRTEQDLHL